MADFADGFQLMEFPSRAMNHDNNFQNALTLEMSLKKKFFFRSVYDTLDFAADLGGLSSAIRAIFTLILVTVNSYSSY